MKLITSSIMLICLTFFISCDKETKINNDVSPEQITLKQGQEMPVLCFNRKYVQPSKVCPDVYNPVCACEAITFKNPCEAQKKGFYNYEMGNCKEAACVNEEVRRTFYCANLHCPIDIPVCGCNGVTYKSYCRAIMAGVTSWTPGSCESILDVIPPPFRP